jgi:hypothetical protein
MKGGEGDEPGPPAAPEFAMLAAERGRAPAGTQPLGGRSAHPMPSSADLAPRHHEDVSGGPREV